MELLAKEMEAQREVKWSRTHSQRQRVVFKTVDRLAQLPAALAPLSGKWSQPAGYCISVEDGLDTPFVMQMGASALFL